MALILSEKDLEPLYKNPAAMDDLLVMIEESMRAHARGEVAGQVRLETSLVDRKKKFRITTASVPGAGMSMRINALFHGAKDSHFILLFDDQTGDLRAMLDGRELNVWRTGSPAGVAARYLARRGAEKLALLGSGRQARGQLLAIRRAVPSLKQVKVFSPREEHRRAFATEMSAWLGIPVEAVADPRAAVENAPLVSLATNSRSTIVEPDWILPGALVISITSGQLPQKLVASSRVIVSSKEEVLAGESPRQPYAQMIGAGTWSGEKIAGELGEVIVGKIPARQDDSETVVFESVGMPIWDSCAATWAYHWAVEHKLGTSFTFA
jgi:alanine dehydrogenase